MKVKLLHVLLIVTVCLTSCNKDEITDLKKRVRKLEEITGADQPITFKYSTKDDNNVDVIKNSAFYFKSTDWSTSYAGDNGDGTYYIYIERFSDVDWDDYAYIDFYYDANTGEVTPYSMGAGFYHENGRYQDAWFYYWTGENTRVITVKSFDPVTGKIDLTAKGTSTANYSYNEYNGKAMNLDLTFKGKVTVFTGGD